MKTNKKVQSWQQGDCFGIPLLNGDALLAQVLAVEPTVLNSVTCALFDQKIGGGGLVPNVDSLFSVVFTTRDLLDSGFWKVIGNSSINVPRKCFPYESLRTQGFVGAKVIGSRNVTEFANAFCALSPWDDWFDPQYLDQLLLRADLKPADLLYKEKK